MSGSSPWFDGRQFDPAVGGTSFPVGRHLAIIKAGVRTPVKDKPNEAYLGLTIEIIDGPHKGVSGIYRMNLWNANPQSCEIAAKQLTALCCVTGRFDIFTPNASELFGIPFFIIVQQQAAPNDRYTEIVAVLDVNGNQPVKGQGPTGGQPQQQQPVAPPQQWQQPTQPPQQPGWQQPPAQQPQPPQQQPQWQAPNASPPTAQSPQQPGWANPPQQQPAAQPQQPQWQQQPPAGAKPSWAG